GAAGWRRLAALAAEQRVRPAVYDALMRRHAGVPVPADVATGLEADYRRLAALALLRQAELLKLLRALGAAGVPVILLKGACLANLVYGDLVEREMHDLDLLVPPAQLLRAVDLVRAAGFAPLAE